MPQLQQPYFNKFHSTPLVETVRGFRRWSAWPGLMLYTERELFREVLKSVGFDAWEGLPHCLILLQTNVVQFVLFGFSRERAGTIKGSDMAETEDC